MTLIIIINRLFCAPFATSQPSKLDNRFHIYHGKNATMDGYDDVRCKWIWCSTWLYIAHVCMCILLRAIAINASF